MLAGIIMVLCLAAVVLPEIGETAKDEKNEEDEEE